MPTTNTSFDIVPQQTAQQPTAQIPEPWRQAEVTFNRAPDPKSVTANSVFVFLTDGAKKIRVPQKNLTVSGNSVTLLLADAIEAGTLEIAGGVDNSFKPSTAPVTAQDDGTALDGDYDNGAGGDFLLPFSQLIIP
jgi:phage baseplate assembly protein gpV